MTGISDTPRFFTPSPHLCDAVNGRIVQSEIEGGVHLRDVVPGTVLEVRTQNREYTIQYQGSGQALISGHPIFCPEPVLVNIHGSTWGGSMLKERFIGRGIRARREREQEREILAAELVADVVMISPARNGTSKIKTNGDYCR